MYVLFEKRLSVLSDDREGAPLPAPVELAAPTSKGLWEKLSNYSLRFYLTLACNRYGNDHPTGRQRTKSLHCLSMTLNWPTFPMKTGPHVVLRRRVTWSELEKALKCPRLRQNSFCCKFAVRPCDLSKVLRGVGPLDSLQHPSPNFRRRDAQELQGKGGRELSRGHGRTPSLNHS